MNQTKQDILDQAVRERNEQTKLCYILRKEPNEQAEIYLWQAPIVACPREMFFEEPAAT